MPHTILVIEDDIQIREMLKKMFEQEKYVVLEAENGDVGIKLYKNNMVDLVITDIIMPEKEGIETIRELKKYNPEIKIIAMSGGGTVEPEQYLHLAHKLGVMRTFAKPFRRDELLNAIKELI